MRPPFGPCSLPSLPPPSKALVGAEVPGAWSVRTGVSNSFHAGKPFKLKSLMGAPANITYAMLFGTRFDYDNPTFVTLTNLVYDVVTQLGLTALQASSLSLPKKQNKTNPPTAFVSCVILQTLRKPQAAVRSCCASEMAGANLSGRIGPKWGRGGSVWRPHPNPILPEEADV